jgi:hypothetical protein
VAIIHRVESSARRGFAFRSWKSASCLRRKRFSAARVLWERATRKTSRTASNTTKDNVRKQCATARKTDERNMNAQDYTLQSAYVTGARSHIGRKFLRSTGVINLLHSEPAFSELFLRYLLSRNIRIEEDLVDNLFNSSEKRLARVLLLMANFGKEGKAEPVIPKISQETLAEIVGTTRSRVSFFMNRFRKLGFIEYNGRLEVHSSLLNIVLHDSGD